MKIAELILLFTLYGSMIDAIFGVLQAQVNRDLNGKSMKGKSMKGMKGTSKKMKESTAARPTLIPTAKPQPQPPVTRHRSKSFFAVGSADLEVVACDEATVEIQGSQAGIVTAGSFFIYLQDGDVGCTDCSPLFRFVESIQASAQGTFVLFTRFATVREILGGRARVDVASLALEPLAGCAHSGDVLPTTASGQCDNGPCQALEVSTPAPMLDSCTATWLQKKSDGRCSYTNCFVGTAGDPINCFNCKKTCDNGCGPSGSVLNTDGNFFLFDFGPACCNHDYCWSSTLPRNQCDTEFYDQMKSQCPPLPVSVVALFLPLPLRVPIQSCRVLAAAFYLAVHRTRIANKAYKKAQDDQK